MILLTAPQYIRVKDHCLYTPQQAVQMYASVIKMGRYDLLRSTRHFGGLVWYLVNARRVNGLIIDMLQKDLWQDAVSLVGLFNKVQPHSETAQEASSQQASGLDLLKVKPNQPTLVSQNLIYRLHQSPYW
uniref:Uncharacterized protein n=1 Tax=Oncorhynchus kisutch TaxID=8019 RepID=A0A8C7JCF1_ONCKI